MPYLDQNAGNTPVAGVYAVAAALAFDDDGGGAAGVYTASVAVPAGATLLDIIIDGIALWNAGTSAAMIVGDATDPNGYYDAVNLKATDLLAGESISFSEAGGKAGAYIASSQVSPRYKATARTITAQVTTVGTAPTTGSTRMTVVYALVASPVSSTYAAT